MMRAAAVVLAAGAGTRLGGRCKAALRLGDGRTFAAAIGATAREAGCVDVVVVAAAPHLAETRVAAVGARVVENPAPERGMIESLRLGIAALAADVDVALVWPVDHPAVRSSTVAAVIGAARRTPIVVPCFGGRGGHPAAIARSVWPELAAAPDARGVIRRDPARVTRISVEDPAVLVDVDTPSDYDMIKIGPIS
jgi:CTP:molybdopterin cytidylyltransferase MocA